MKKENKVIHNLYVVLSLIILTVLLCTNTVFAEQVYVIEPEDETSDEEIDYLDGYSGDETYETGETYETDETDVVTSEMRDLETDGNSYATVDGIDYDYIDNGDGTISIEHITHSGKNIYNLVIPSMINGKTVTGIAAYHVAVSGVFSNTMVAQGSLTLPDTLVTIGRKAFYGCSRLTGKLTIPNSVTTIEESAFDGCTGFSSLNLGDKENSKLETIGINAFRVCNFAGTLEIPSSVKTISGGAFAGCKWFAGALEIPENVTAIGNNAFQNCTGFNGTLKIGKKVETIETGAFYECNGFTKDLIIPDSVKYIGASAFYKCTGFTGSLTIGNGVSTIGYTAFSGCNGFKGNLTLGSNLKTIRFRAFENCSGFTGGLDIPEGVEIIQNDAFNGCRGLTTLVFPKSISDLGGMVIYGCSGLKKVENRSSFVVDLPFTPSGQFWIDNASGERIMSIEANRIAVRSDYVSDKKDISKASISGIKDKTFTGKAITQSPKVMFDDEKLKLDTDYKISYKNNKDAGTATMTITGKGDYKGSVKKTFRIKKAPIEISANTVSLNKSDLKKGDQKIKVGKAFNITKNTGKMTFKKKSGSKKISISNKGKVTVRTGLKKGTYKVKVRVKADGDKNHKKAAETVTLKVIVK